MMTWGEELLFQLTWHWDRQLRPRLDGLTDEEYLWEPVADCWTVRPREGAGERQVVGKGEAVMDCVRPELEPTPVTTIAWRMSHITVGVFGERNHTYFDGPALTHESYEHPLSAVTALADLDAQQVRWCAGVASLTDEDLGSNCHEPGLEELTVAALVLHIHREVIHHGAEIALLRDLYLRR